MNKVPPLQLIDDKPPLPECYGELTRLLNTHRLYAFGAAPDSQIKHAEILKEIYLLCSEILRKDLYLEWEDSDKKSLEENLTNAINFYKDVFPSSFQGIRDVNKIYSHNTWYLGMVTLRDKLEKTRLLSRYNELVEYYEGRPLDGSIPNEDIEESRSLKTRIKNIPD